MKFRKDIDSLRGISVLGVLLFHLDLNLISGGFSGVDVFFVISGYLITKKIAEDIQRGTFSFTSFYQRRILRLFPTFASVIILTSMWLFFAATPEIFKKFSQQLLYASLSLSNFFFLQEHGYFAAESHQLHLLHTWSLGIEEQFYLFWPLLLYLYLKGTKKKSALLLSTIAFSLSLGSLALSEVINLQLIS